MEIAITAGLAAKRDMKVNAGQIFDVECWMPDLTMVYWIIPFEDSTFVMKIPK